MPTTEKLDTAQVIALRLLSAELPTDRPLHEWTRAQALAGLASGVLWVINRWTISAEEDDLSLRSPDELSWLNEEGDDPDPDPVWTFGTGFVAVR